MKTLWKQLIKKKTDKKWKPCGNNFFFLLHFFKVELLIITLVMNTIFDTINHNRHVNLTKISLFIADAFDNYKEFIREEIDYHHSHLPW